MVCAIAQLKALNFEMSPLSFPELTHGSDNGPVIHEDVDLQKSQCGINLDFMIFTAICYNAAFVGAV